ncbi:hypothetical protein DIJ63_24575 [Burkholderia pseudomallei]|nr:hypothetical protein DIJ63_24575 [Burkholderia pseudomallei]
MRLGHVWAPLRCCVSACDGVVRSCCRAILLSRGPAAASFGPAGVARRARAARRLARHQYAPPTRCSATK